MILITRENRLGKIFAQTENFKRQIYNDICNIIEFPYFHIFQLKQGLRRSPIIQSLMPLVHTFT